MFLLLRTLNLMPAMSSITAHIGSKAENQHWVPMTFDPSGDTALKTGILTRAREHFRILLSVDTIGRSIYKPRLKKNKKLTCKQKPYVHHIIMHAQFYFIEVEECVKSDVFSCGNITSMQNTKSALDHLPAHFCARRRIAFLLPLQSH